MWITRITDGDRCGNTASISTDVFSGTEKQIDRTTGRQDNRTRGPTRETGSGCRWHQRTKLSKIPKRETSVESVEIGPGLLTAKTTQRIRIRTKQEKVELSTEIDDDGEKNRPSLIFPKYGKISAEVFSANSPGSVLDLKKTELSDRVRISCWKSTRCCFAG